MYLQILTSALTLITFLKHQDNQIIEAFLNAIDF